MNLDKYNIKIDRAIISKLNTFFVDCALALDINQAKPLTIYHDFSMTLLENFMLCSNKTLNNKLHAKYNLKKTTLSDIRLSLIAKISLKKIIAMKMKHNKKELYNFVKTQNENILLCQLSILAHKMNYDGFWDIVYQNKSQSNKFIAVKN